MLKFILKRLGIAAVILFGVTVGVFFLVQMQPGNPYSQMIDPTLSKEMVEDMLRKLGYYDPMHIKYLKWTSSALKGDLGYSIRYGGPVTALIGEKLVNTAILGGFSFLVSSVCGILLGIFLSTKNGSKRDHFAEAIFFLMVSIPTFFFGLIFIKFFSLNFKFFPSSGMVTLGKTRTGMEYFLDLFKHMILPGLTLGIGQFAVISKYTKINMLGVMNKEYMKTARMKGLSKGQALMNHGLKNILLPTVTILSLQLPIFLSGSLITETIFVWPGIGRLNYEAIVNKDYPLIMAILLFTALLILITNLIADILYVLIDKRIKC